MKFHIQKDLVTQIFYFKSRPDPVSLGGVERGEPEILEKAQSGEIRMKLGGKNKHKSEIGD